MQGQIVESGPPDWSTEPQVLFQPLLAARFSTRALTDLLPRRDEHDSRRNDSPELDDSQ